MIHESLNEPSLSEVCFLFKLYSLKVTDYIARFCN